jgi:collagenase-like PrtC family protease
MPPDAPSNIELLAPAGDPEALAAALDAGASAVYLGLTTLNARRGARNFRPDELAAAVQTAHAHGARVYLTLNIDLDQREIGQAARMLELARSCGVDAVLVRDPALLALRPLYPQLEFHFSTQTCICSSVDMAAARELGAQRAVLAREMTLDEIAAASAVAGIQTEVFVQGALCFCISGRCLLSSWAGGRSGNRGTCTSPCRVPWTVGGCPVGTPLSMRDLSTVHRLADLRRCGVAALKIEGRLKSAAWVAQAVTLYRRALAGEDPADLQQRAELLGSYAGRQMTSDYLDGQRDHLTALAAGRSAPNDAAPIPQPSDVSAPAPEPQPSTDGYGLHIEPTAHGITCRCTLDQRSIQWQLPSTVVRRAHKAITVRQLLDYLARQNIDDCPALSLTSSDDQFLLVPRAANNLETQLVAAIRQLRKAPDDTIRIELPAAVRALVNLAQHSPCPQNSLHLGDPPDRARLDAHAIGGFLHALRTAGRTTAMPRGLIVENAAAPALEHLHGQCAGLDLIVALPAVFFEPDIPSLQRLCRQCADLGIPLEVNSWGGWELARQCGAAFECGPGLPVLNALAAQFLAGLGARCVTASIEADRRQLEDLSARCPVPLSLTVMGRPALLTTRVQMPRQQFLDQTLTDRRHVELTARIENGLWVFRPPQPFDLRSIRNPRISAHHLVVDLVASPDPAGDWLHRPQRSSSVFRFNYNRRLA